MNHLICQQESPKLINKHIVAALILLLALADCATPAPDHPRRVKMSVSRNLRDLGGYTTVDGREVKKGLLYRSDSLARLSRRDLELLGGLGLKRIYDLRSENERKKDPNRLPEGSVSQVVEIPIYYAPMDPEVTRRRILKGEVEKGDFHQAMLESYRAYALEYLHEWSILLRGLAEADSLPALINCTHGKDRTGIAVAIVFRSLGLSQETVLDDYMLSNIFWEKEASRLSCLAYGASFFRTPRSEVRTLLEVRPEYLDAAFAAIDERYGSFEGYLHEGLGIDSVTLERLRAALLD